MESESKIPLDREEIVVCSPMKKKTGLQVQVPIQSSYSSNNGSRWNKKLEQQLVRIGNRAAGYKWMHNEESTHYTEQWRVINLVEIIFVTLHGASIATSFVAIFAETGSPLIMMILTCIQTVFYIMSTIIKSYKEGTDYSSKIYDHRWSSIKFSQISTEIQNQFCLDISKRVDDESFLEYRSTDFNDALFGAPVIRPKTVKRYLDSIKDPASFGLINQFEIVLEPSLTNNNQIEPPENTGDDNKNKAETDRQYDYELERFLKYC